MGIDFSIGEDYKYPCPHWSYGGFHDFRASIARLIGMRLEIMQGFCRDKEKLPKSWDKWKDDPICLLLNHSDCDGELSPEDCKKCAPRLRELAGKLSDDYDRANGLMLADCMDECWKRDVPLVFC